MKNMAGLTTNSRIFYEFLREPVNMFAVIRDD